MITDKKLIIWLNYRLKTTRKKITEKKSVMSNRNIDYRLKWSGP